MLRFTYASLLTNWKDEMPLGGCIPLSVRTVRDDTISAPIRTITAKDLNSLKKKVIDEINEMFDTEKYVIMSDDEWVKDDELAYPQRYKLLKEREEKDG